MTSTSNTHGYETDSDLVGASAVVGNRLKESDPGLDTKQHPELILRDGFTAGGKVFYVTTDVAKFEMEKMPEVVAALRAHVLGKREGEAVKGSSR